MPSAEEPLPIKQQIQQLANIEDAMAVDKLPETQGLPDTQSHTNAQDLPSSQELSIDQDQDLADAQVNSNDEENLNTQQYLSPPGFPSTRELPADQDIPNTQQIPADQVVSDAHVLPDTQAHTNARDLPHGQSPHNEQDLSKVETTLNAEDVPNISENPSTGEPDEQLIDSRSEAPTIQDDPAIAELPPPELPHTEEAPDFNEARITQNPPAGIENQNIGEPPNGNRLPNLLEAPSIEELLVREVSSALELTTAEAVTNNEEPVSIRKKQRSAEVEADTGAGETADTRHPKRHKSGKKKFQDDKKAKAKSKCKNKKTTTKRETAKTRKDEGLFGCNVTVVEMPSENDFDRICGPLRTSYSWGPPKSRKAKARSGFAPPPAIPPAGDDSEGALNISARDIFNRGRDSEPESDGEQERTKERERKEERERLEELRRRMRERRLKYGFLQLPSEIREEIYRYLLVSPKPVMVRAGWMRIYERERPGLSTGILLVNHRINEEAVRVLYSENTFLYRLRDPPNTGAAVADIQGLARNDDRSEADTDYEDPREFDYDDSPISQRSSRKKRKPRWDINLTKFGEYFRHLTVQAEYNRYDHNVMQSMAQAVRVFTAQPGNGTKASTKDGKARATNINTFTIRVAPMATSDGFTFVNFFKFDSPVIKALEQLSCQRIHVEILAQHLDPTTMHTGLRLSMDMRYCRIHRRAGRGDTPGQKDIWHNDPCILVARTRRVRAAAHALATLEQNVFDWCRKCASAYLGEEDDFWAEGFWFEDEFVDEELGL